MKKTVFGLMAVAAAVTGLNLPANAETVFINSDGSMTTLDTTVMPTTTTQIITQPAVIEPVITTPRVVERPVVVRERRRGHLLNVGLPGLFGVHLF